MTANDNKPAVLRLKFCTIINDDLTEGFGAALQNPENEVTHYAGDLKTVASWLQKHGYEWLKGTNGLWSRER